MELNMNKVKLVIQEHQSGVDFKIQNIDELDSKIVEELEAFAVKRNGYFRHDLARFDIKRKLNQKQVLQIFELLDITVEIVDDDINDGNSVSFTSASQETVDFGKYKGFRWCDIPLPYLEWIYKENENNYAYVEIKRRQHSPQEIENEIIKFGKYKEQKWINLPINYLEWVLNQFSEDKEAHKFAKLALKYKEVTS